MSTAIPYLDEVWNVTTGCGDDIVSPGCEHCYARRMTGRNMWAWDFTAQYQGDRRVPGKTWNLIDQPLHWRKPRRIGVSFMGDIMHEAIGSGPIGKTISRMMDCPQHRFLVLTKRAERLPNFIWPDNAWLGVTVCNQEEADRNIPILLATPAAVRWVSIEPMLGPVDFRKIPQGMKGIPLGWVVLGGESGPGARPMKARWAVDVFKQCEAAGVPFYWKQPGSWLKHEDSLGPDGRDWEAWDRMEQTHELPAVPA